LSGKKVAVKNGTEGATFAESIATQYGFTLTYFKDSAMMYEDVKAGNSQACFEDFPVLGYAISQNVGLKIVTEKERGSSYGFAVKKGENAELLAKWDAGYQHILTNGTYQAILDKYIQK
jgi:polar amino acid transport system substrate-binding protein